MAAQEEHLLLIFTTNLALTGARHYSRLLRRQRRLWVAAVAVAAALSSPAAPTCLGGSQQEMAHKFTSAAHGRPLAFFFRIHKRHCGGAASRTGSGAFCAALAAKSQAGNIQFNHDKACCAVKYNPKASFVINTILFFSLIFEVGRLNLCLQELRGAR